MVVETNLDDSSAELVGTDFQNELIQNGAIDFYFTPIHMKKGRPGLMLSALVAPSDLDRLSTFILEHSPSIGLRYHTVERTILTRKQFELETPYGKVLVKQVITPSGSKRHKIEYESLQKLKENHNISILRLQELIYPLLLKIQDQE
ncbi:MAG: DUF111 family protein [Saprospiraceae bacterium]|nr:DUF111 family protein [Saprospiraceae bacterium]